MTIRVLPKTRVVLAMCLLTVLAGCVGPRDDSGVAEIGQVPGPVATPTARASEDGIPSRSASEPPVLASSREATAPGARVRDSAPPSVPGPHLRVIWTRDLGDGTDYNSSGDQLVLMAYDSEDDRGERVVLSEPASYAKPLITPDGESVVFTIRRPGAVHAIDWDGSGLRRIADGFALDVWSDPEDGTTWVYVGGDEVPTDPPRYPVVRRFRLEDPSVSEVVWEGQPVNPDTFQVSADGRTAVALLPWPTVGVADLTTGTWRKLGEGCWTAISPGAEPLLWYFDGAHRNLTFVNHDTDERWGVSISDDPFFGGYEVYHPRWTNDRRAFVLTGPYTVGRRANKIRGGGKQVEVMVGFFDETLTSVASWRRVTHNDAPDFYPDAWIEPGTGPAPGELGVPLPGGPGAVAVRSSDARRVVVDVRVRQQVALPTPESIAPYREGLLALEYDVVQVTEGELDLPVIAVAHWVIRDARLVAGAERRAGERLQLTLHPYDARPELEGKRLVFETTDLALPLFYDLASANLGP